jgi:hypothetical protein
MLRSLLAGLVAVALPLAPWADPALASARERASPAPSSEQRAEARGGAHGAGAKSGLGAATARARHARTRPARSGERDRDPPRRLPTRRQECREVSEPPLIALYLVGLGGLALLGRRRPPRDAPPGAQRQREIR